MRPLFFVNKLIIQCWDREVLADENIVKIIGQCTNFTGKAKTE